LILNVNIESTGMRLLTWIWPPLYEHLINERSAEIVVKMCSKMRTPENQLLTIRKAIIRRQFSTHDSWTWIYLAPNSIGFKIADLVADVVFLDHFVNTVVSHCRRFDIWCRKYRHILLMMYIVAKISNILAYTKSLLITLKCERVRVCDFILYICAWNSRCCKMGKAKGPFYN